MLYPPFNNLEYNKCQMSFTALNYTSKLYHIYFSRLYVTLFHIQNIYHVAVILFGADDVETYFKVIFTMGTMVKVATVIKHLVHVYIMVL